MQMLGTGCGGGGGRGGGGEKYNCSPDERGTTNGAWLPFFGGVKICALPVVVLSPHIFVGKSCFCSFVTFSRVWFTHKKKLSGGGLQP